MIDILYINDAVIDNFNNTYAVIISKNGGWSSVNGYQPRFLFCPFIVFRMIESKPFEFMCINNIIKINTKDYNAISKAVNKKNIYIDGLHDIEIVWVPYDYSIHIDVSNGAEILHTRKF